MLQLLLQMHLLLVGVPKCVVIDFTNASVDCGKCLNVLQLLLQMHLLIVGSA